MNFTAFDMSTENSKLRPLWKHYFVSSNAIMWVIDSSDRGRLQESVAAFKMLQQELKDSGSWSEIKMLVIATKTDLPNCLTLGEIILALDLVSLPVWNCVALHQHDTNTLMNALDWLAQDV
mmetsp:Transcript_4143/g.5793  ORF Transcript_4143/g.5793 Transcript_4143/m.5793 type:complete len:121 (+) Transcript_4143:102-464(+)